MKTAEFSLANPLAGVGGWPLDEPLVALVSCGEAVEWSRWSVLARPRGWVRARMGASGAAVYDTVGDAPEIRGDPVDAIDRLLAWGRGRAGSGVFSGGWIGWISYDLGRWIEPTARSHASAAAAADREHPLWEFAWCPDAVVYDGVRRAWQVVGEGVPGVGGAVERGYRVGALAAEWPRAEYERGVERVIEHIRGGEAYQVNLAHRLAGSFQGSVRGWFEASARRARPWFGAYLESGFEDGPTLASLSPELFLSIEGGRLTTRPMKGTLPGGEPPEVLEDSAKDRAELAMIVDLARNDLGRVGEIGSIGVVEARRIERHAGERSLWQGVATVEGRLRTGVGMGEVLRATFPPGSVTGAPKIRAMRLIDEVEPVRRGAYCGCAGWLGVDGSARLSVLIRTGVVQGERVAGRPGEFARARLDYSVGAGIVADSVPGREWEETLSKAGAVERISGGEGCVTSK